MSPTSYRTAPPRVVKTPYGTERNGLLATSHSSPIGCHNRCTVATMSNLTGPFDTGKLARIAPGSVTVTIARTIAPGKGDAFRSLVRRDARSGAAIAGMSRCRCFASWSGLRCVPDGVSIYRCAALASMGAISTARRTALSSGRNDSDRKNHSDCRDR